MKKKRVLFLFMAFPYSLLIPIYMMFFGGGGYDTLSIFAFEDEIGEFNIDNIKNNNVYLSSNSDFLIENIYVSGEICNFKEDTLSNNKVISILDCIDLIEKDNLHISISSSSGVVKNFQQMTINNELFTYSN
ncbi:MAG: hypothetical protein HRU03_06830 [Nanoarchaeales archaeon]|nr:hypothetical protein [Nanoarchaeales archaeon]